MGNKWTDEQLDAINSRNISVIVSAAAGSGKTSVLVERLIKIIADTENKIPANQMIIATFTNDATTEMKQRLSLALTDMIEKNPENDWLIKQQSLLQCAKISTINAFCFDLIRENIQDTDVSAGFRIIDENENKIIIQNCIEDTIEFAYVNMPDEMDILYRCFCNNDDKPIEKILQRIYKFMQSVPYGNYWLDSVCKQFENPEFVKNITDSYIKKISKKLDIAVQNASKALDIVNENNDDEKAYSKTISILENELIKLSDIAEIFNDNPEKLKDNNVFKFETLRFPKVIPDDDKIKVKNLRDEYKQIYNDFISKELNIILNAEDGIKSHIKICAIIKNLIHILNEKINDVKIIKNGLGFSDAEQIALKLLSDIDENGVISKSKLAEELSEYYKVVMIDEFQDSNNNQDLIFKLISHNGNAYKNGDNMFLVGDVKQAIYGFRLSNPKIFTETMKNSIRYDKDCTENAYIKLNKNFRSSQEVIDFVNYIFSKIMSKDIGETDYNDEEMLIKGADFADTDKITEIALIEEDDEHENITALWTAQKIADMLKNHAPVCNRDGVTVRPCECKDFCILLRDNASAPFYAAELKKFGINAYSEETVGYVKSREISLMLNLLRVIDNPLIDTALVSIMLSPMFSFTPDEVTEIRLVNRNSNMYIALCNAIGETKIAVQENDTVELKKSEPLINGSAYEKAVNLFDIINELRMYSATDTLEQLIRRIYERTDFLSIMQIYKDSEKKKANLRILIEYAKSYENSSNGGLSGFLRFIERSTAIDKNNFKHGTVASSSENVVSIKTMHKSKGLEFPFVFVCNTEKKFNKMDLNMETMLDYDYGIGFTLQNPDLLMKYSTVPYEFIKEKKYNSLLSEELRLLYVTLTRAKDKLFIPIKINDELKKKINLFCSKISSEKGITTDIAGSANSMRDWILMALLSCKNSAYLRDICGIPQIFEYNDDFSVKYTSFNSSDIENLDINDDKTEVKISEVNIENINMLQESFDYFNSGYDFTFSQLPAKLSVSEISKDETEFEKKLKRPEFVKNIKKLTGSEIGTALHTFMQYADFNSLQKNIDNELQLCVSKGFITQKESENINSDKIKEFINSSLFKRIENADNVQRERRFMVSLNDIDAENIVNPKYCGRDIILQGIADMTFEEDGKLVIVDYKTDYVRSPEILKEKYQNQLILYKLAFEKIDNREVKECIIYSFTLGQCIIIK